MLFHYIISIFSYLIIRVGQCDVNMPAPMDIV